MYIYIYIYTKLYIFIVYIYIYSLVSQEYSILKFSSKDIWGYMKKIIPKVVLKIANRKENRLTSYMPLIISNPFFIEIDFAKLLLRFFQCYKYKYNISVKDQTI